MTIKDIEKLVASDESRTLELKKTTGELKDAMHTACAFLNSDGGWLIFGVTPTSHRILGQDVTDNTKQEIARALSGLEPLVDAVVEYIVVPESNGKQVIALHFEEWVRGGAPYTYHGSPYYKVESTTQPMPRYMFEERLKEHSPFKFAWDSQIAEGYKMEDIDENRVRGAVRLGVSGGRLNASAEIDDISSLLKKMKLMKDDKLTNAAVMLFGKNTDNYPQLLLRMACFKGTDKNIFIDNKRESGNFFELLDAGIAFCFRHLNLSGVIIGLQRKEELEIPLPALREALTNALCHRSYDDPSASVSLAVYSDRIEIVNPGRFPIGITSENIMLPHESFPHNQTIAHVLYQTTFLESWGSGVKRMCDICIEKGVPVPTYHEGPKTITICFRKIKKEIAGDNHQSNHQSNRQISDNQQRIIDFCTVPRSSSEIMEMLGISNQSKNRQSHIVPLIELGLLQMTNPENPKDRNQKYIATTKVLISQNEAAYN